MLYWVQLVLFKFIKEQNCLKKVKSGFLVFQCAHEFGCLPVNSGLITRHISLNCSICAFILFPVNVISLLSFQAVFIAAGILLSSTLSALQTLVSFSMNHFIF
jgi:hypothetical protein